MKKKFIFLISLIFFAISRSERSQIHCQDPYTGASFSRNQDRKFLLFGSAESGGAGLGNLLIFFPAAYYFAAFTGHDIVIPDSSVVGEFCKVVNCGFPFLSDLASAFPTILSDSNIHSAQQAKAVDFNAWMDGNKEFDGKVVTALGYQPKSEWWVWYNTTVQCVHRLTGCDLGDIACADRHAYQRFIRGPFRAALSEKEEKKIFGVPDHIKHGILTLPHAFAPRLDVSVHLRTQFHHFEQHTDPNDPEYKREVAEWLGSDECKSVFQAIQDKLHSLVRDDSSFSPDQPLYVYLASDNEEVKDTLVSLLEGDPAMHTSSNSSSTSSSSSSSDVRVRVMRIETTSIHHAKNLAKLKDETQNEGLLDLVFDWYALSLSDRILAWRKGSTKMISTYVQSAQRVSGNAERTDVTGQKGIGHGIGTEGLQLIKDRRGTPQWDRMWTYSFLEDYQ